jgi:hypothetical protein
MMNLTRLITAVFMIVTLANAAFAESPASVDEGTIPTDGGSAASDPGTNVEVISSDEGAVATDAGTPSGVFSPNPCWDEQCTAESAACQADANCTSFNACWKHSGTAEEKQACFADLQESLGQEGYDAANTMHQSLRECGWAACNDPNAGSCADAGKDGAANRCGQWDDAWACNCDDACSQFSDCCSDMETVCAAAGGSCAGACGSADPQGSCYCDEQCAQNGDCCPDYETECGGGTCTPDCFGKQCGDDGCGGTCGSCEGNFECNADAQCVAPSTGTDSGSTTTDSGSTTSGDNTSVNQDTAVAADAGSNPGTGNGGSGGSDSGGCAANSQAHTPWALIVLCAMLALGLRRRRPFQI